MKQVERPDIWKIAIFHLVSGIAEQPQSMASHGCAD